MLEIFVTVPGFSGAHCISDDNQDVFDSKIKQFLTEYRQWAYSDREHWESFPGSSVSKKVSIGWLRRESDQMLEQRVEFGIRETALSKLVPVNELLV